MKGFQKINILGLLVCLPMLMFGQELALPNGKISSQLAAKGEGRFRRFGFHVYDAQLWSSGTALQVPYALQLKYYMNIKAAKIVDASIDEMQRNTKNKALLEQWKKQLDKVIPTVKKGDVITGVDLGNAAQFYHNGNLVGTVNDAKFASAFFGIWLDKNTGAPKLRRKLLQLN